MKLKTSHLIVPSLLALMLGVTACSKQDAPAPAATAAKRPVSTEIIAAEAKGFTVGAVMSANTAYVFFDPQCPHCGHLWQTALPLHNKLKFVWIPVSILGQASAPQGAALLTAANPAQAMTDHEKSLLDRQGGISAPANPPAEVMEAIRKNTQLLNEFGADSVPYIVVKNARTGQLDTRSGAMETDALAQFVGVAP
jgi:thiol:disulfide interchange protein DsbG